jgi:hypothetical protein
MVTTKLTNHGTLLPIIIVYFSAALGAAIVILYFWMRMGVPKGLARGAAHGVHEASLVVLEKRLAALEDAEDKGVHARVGGDREQAKTKLKQRQTNKRLRDLEVSIDELKIFYNLNC